MVIVKLSLLSLAFALVCTGKAHTQELPPCEPLEWPGNSRKKLALPDDLWDNVVSNTLPNAVQLGYTPAQMSDYQRDTHLMRTTLNLFRDVRTIPRFSYRTSQNLFKFVDKTAELLRSAFLCTDISAGRYLPMPDSASWGVDWISDKTSAATAIANVLAYREKTSEEPTLALRISREQGQSWLALPDPVRRLVIRIFIGVAEAAPWIRASIDSTTVKQALGADLHDAVALGALYDCISAPWSDGRQGQRATLQLGAFDIINSLRREPLAFGSVILQTHIDRALREFRAAEADSAIMATLFEPIAIPTSLGEIRIFGPKRDVITGPALLTIDVGGDDKYTGRQAVPHSFAAPVSLVIDLGGKDDYIERDSAVAMACGLFGFGAIYDLAGSDIYHIREAGLGAAFCGAGLIMDFAGNDIYIADKGWAQGAAIGGVGALLDLDGDDEYLCGFQSQGFGSTLGAGVLCDVKGNDRYTARDDGNPSAEYGGKSVSMAQGVGYGRRADLGDGSSLAGGFGVLADGAGNDAYSAQSWSQGAGYWWGVGILEDRSGDDTYRNGKYALGAAAHFAIGCHIDTRGNDAYNLDNTFTENQFQGHARDGSIGISIDGDGDDRYKLESHCAGSADLCSIGLFWDRRGNDVYTSAYTGAGKAKGWSNTPPFGTTTVYTPFNTFRDDLTAVGIFLDTGGRDTYQGLEAPSENSEWSSRRNELSRGFGVDCELYPAAHAAE